LVVKDVRIYLETMPMQVSISHTCLINNGTGMQAPEQGGLIYINGALLSRITVSQRRMADKLASCLNEASLAFRASILDTKR
jgi:hypothetical protein